jgi:hypothetical protein
MSKQAMHMVIPYMPMLGPPQNWTGYGIQLSIKISGYLINLNRGGSWQKILFNQRIWDSGSKK